jgi:26S proteasome regulatory subunit N12
VIQFAEHRKWLVRDGRIYFPKKNVRAVDGQGEVVKEISQVAIENTLGYARELETIV